MTLYGLLASLAWSGVAGYTVSRAAALGARWMAWRERPAPMVETPRGPVARPTRAQVELPDDLVAVAMQESEAWAKDDMVLSLKEKFVEMFTGDTAETWQRVRRSVGIGELP